MKLRSSVSALAVVAVCAALTLGAAAPASAAVAPGDGAVVFNADGSPIGSELTYGADATPQFVYTSTTGDDDSWGLIDGTPVNDYSATAGIPLGFGVNVQGSVYEQVAVGSNGAVCLVPADDAAATAIYECSSFSFSPLSSATQVAADDPERDSTVFMPLYGDQNPTYGVPVDLDADDVPDACTYGSFLFENDGDYYCSTVSWGSTSYEGKPAFAVTWYHNPEYAADDESRYNTYQLILVDNGAGDATVVFNYDETNLRGSSAGNLASETALAADCAIAEEAGDDADYSSVGYSSYSATTTEVSALDLFGPACLGGLTPTPTEQLMTGGLSQLSLNSLNSTVAGRYAFALVDGFPTLTLPAVIVDPVVVAPAAAAPAAQLAATGLDAESAIAFGSMLLAAGLALVVWRRTRTIAE